MTKENFREEEHPRDKLGQFTKLSTKELKEKLKIDYGKFVKTGETTVITPEIKEGDYRGSDKYPQTSSVYFFQKEPPLRTIYGREYKGYKGQKAVEKLLIEKAGHVKNAFYVEGIGNIDLIWGNDNIGLKHIIQRRIEQNIKISTFISELANVIEKGSIINEKNKNGNYELYYNNKLAVIAPEYHNQKATFTLTAFNTRKRAPKKALK